MYDPEQIPARCLTGRLRCGLSGSSWASAPVQLSEVYPTPPPGLLGTQGVPPPQLPRADRALGRPRRNDPFARLVIPHFTIFQKAAARLLRAAPARRRRCSRHRPHRGGEPEVLL